MGSLHEDVDHGKERLEPDHSTGDNVLSFERSSTSKAPDFK